MREPDHPTASTLPHTVRRAHRTPQRAVRLHLHRLFAMRRTFGRVLMFFSVFCRPRKSRGSRSKLLRFPHPLLAYIHPSTRHSRISLDRWNRCSDPSCAEGTGTLGYELSKRTLSRILHGIATVQICHLLAPSLVERCITENEIRDPLRGVHQRDGIKRNNW